MRENPIVRCKECGFIQLGAHPTEESIKSTYSDDYFKKIKYHFDSAAKREQERRVNLMKECGVAHGADVLDVGCATGDFILLARNYFSIWGIDISEQAVQTAKERNPDVAARIIAMGHENFENLDRRFDAITLWDVIEHLDDPVGVVRKLTGKLERTGVLFISSPNIGAMIARIMKRHWAFMTPPEHIGYFSRETVKRLLAACGLRELRWETRGKWINLAFLAYKMSRVFPELAPPLLVKSAFKSRFGRVTVYVPTRDIQYVAAVPD